MFRVLSNEESHLVKKWRAPSLKDSDSVSNSVAGVPEPSIDSDEVATTDIAHLRNSIKDDHADTHALNEEFTAEQNHTNNGSSSHASLAMLSPSADMLQVTYDEGFSAGVEATKSKTDDAAAGSLVSLLSDLTQQKHQIDADIERELVALAKAVAKMLLRREVETDDEVILEIVRKALAQMPMMTETPTVVLNPIDLDIVASVQATPILAKLIPDTEMMRGSCRVQSGASILEAGIDALVESISSTSAQVPHNQAEFEQINASDTTKADQ